MDFDDGSDEVHGTLTQVAPEDQIPLRGGNGEAMGSTETTRPLVNEGKSTRAPPRRLLAPLTLLPQEALDTHLKRIGYEIVEKCMRVLPFLTIYGGTLALIACVILRYRWGVLMSMMLYSCFMFLSALELVVGGAWGMIMVWMNIRNDWYGMYVREVLGDTSPRVRRNDSPASPLNAGSGADSPPMDRMMPPPTRDWAENGEIGWNDLLHVVMIPSYKTPMEVLRMALHAVMNYKLCRTNLGICFAFEEREQEAQAKAEQLKDEYAGEFAFVTATFHPPNLPGHIPGKSSNECWAFQELCKEMRSVRGFEPDDPRVVITVIDDDSELHENYFEGLSYHYLKASEDERYTTLFQPPIVHFKNFLTQPILVRNASLFTSLHELACLANPVDCHVAFSSYSLSFILANAVQGWDPDFISEDWHMTAKCKLMTEGRANVKPIFLPLMNYAPEEEDAWSTVTSRWTQAKRHALGMSEIVYVATKMYIGMCECGDFWRGAVFIYRMLPLLGKFIAVHFVVATLAFWPPLSHILINFYMWHSWCYIEELPKTCSDCCLPMALATEVGIGEERIILNSWMVYFQEKANVCFFAGLVIAGSWGAFYFHLVRERVEGSWDSDWVVRNPLFLWIRTWLEVSVLGWFSSAAFGSVPEWVAAFRIMFTLQFHHVVAGMVGRKDGDDAEGTL